MKLAYARIPRITTMLWVVGALAIGFLWHRSFDSADTVLLFAPGDRMQGVTSTVGGFQLIVSNLSAGSRWSWSADVISNQLTWLPGRALGRSWAQDAGPTPANMFLAGPLTFPPSGFGFGLQLLDGAAIPVPGAWAVILTVPQWLIGTLFLIVPFHRLIVYRRLGRRLKQGRCPVCGYDLRASQGRCPECGTYI